MRGSTRLSVCILACAIFFPALAFAQASIAGAVKDATGALLPGVTVEASSPALIEKVRSVVTDGAGQYRIIDLRPGTYSVTFTLSGIQRLQARRHRAHGLVHGHGGRRAQAGIGGGDGHRLRPGVRRRRAVRVAPARHQQGHHRRDSGRPWSVRAGRAHPGHDGRRSGRRRLEQPVAERHLDPRRPRHRPAPERGRADAAERGRPGQLHQHRRRRRLQPGNDDRLRRGQRRGRHGWRALQLHSERRRQPVLGLVLRQPDQHQLPEQQLHAGTGGAGPSVAQQAEESVRLQRLGGRPHRQGQGVVLLERTVPAQRKLHRGSLGEQERRRPLQVALRGRPGQSDVQLPEEQHRQCRA